jgi:hypothetical protein
MFYKNYHRKNARQKSNGSLEAAALAASSGFEATNVDILLNSHIRQEPSKPCAKLSRI